MTTGALKERVRTERGPKPIGHVAGIPVGAQFVERCEMEAAGLHNHWMNGIDTIKVLSSSSSSSSSSLFALN